MSANRKRQSLVGQVISIKMNKTVSVRVTREIPHPVYQKRVKRYKKYLAHVASFKPNEGDIVSIASMRPMSKRKRWQISKILQKGLNIKAD